MANSESTNEIPKEGYREYLRQPDGTYKVRVQIPHSSSHPVVIGVPAKTRASLLKSNNQGLKRTQPEPEQVADVKLKEFGVLLVTKNTSLTYNVCSYRTHTFNAPVIKEWTDKNQLVPYILTLNNGPNTDNKIVNKVNSVQIISNINQAMASSESGLANLSWTDNNAEVLINVTSHIW